MAHHTGKLLFDEPPIAVAPTLVRLLGMGAALFLQQLHYFLAQKAKNPAANSTWFIDQRYWVRWSMEEIMRQVPIGKSAAPYKKVIAELRQLGILLVEQHAKEAWQRTNYYAIDVDVLQQFLEENGSVGSSVRNPSDRNGSPKSLDGNSTVRSCSRISADLQTEITTETSAKNSTTDEGPHVDRSGESDLDTGSGGGGDVTVLILSDAAETFRPLVELAVQGIDPIVGQQVADDFSSRLAKVQSGAARPLADERRWLLALVDSFREGRYQPSGGLAIAAERTRKRAATAQHEDADAQRREQEEIARRLAANRIEEAQKRLTGMPAPDLIRLHEIAGGRAGSDKTRRAVRDAIERRTLPTSGLIPNLIVAALHELPRAENMP